MRTREVRQRFLIVCEGAKTEPNYFRAFHAAGLVIDVHGVGANTLAVVRRAIEERNKALDDGWKEDRYDQIWCVFDRDEFPASNFNEALELARREDIGVAYSNEAFEVWYLLHFLYFDTATTRSELCSRLERRLGRPYAKNDGRMYESLVARQPDALRNAEQLSLQYDPPHPSKDNPSTTVHLLIRELNRFLN